MAEINLFSYTEKNTCIHALHPIAKSVSFLVGNLIAFSAGYIGLSVLSIFTLIALKVADAGVMRIIKRSSVLLGFIIFILVFGVFDLRSADTFYVNVVQLQKQGLFIYKLIVTFFITELFLYTTKIADINNTITQATSGIPGLRKLDPGFYIATTLSFIPDIIREYNRISDALKVRSGDTIKNPVRKIMLISLPLITNMIKKGLTKGSGLQVKCYNSSRTILTPPFLIQDGIVVSISIVCYVVLLILK